MFKNIKDRMDFFFLPFFFPHKETLGKIFKWYNKRIRKGLHKEYLHTHMHIPILYLELKF